MIQSPEGSVGTVARTIDLLRYFAEYDQATIRSLSSTLGQAPSTCHQLLHLLAREGMVEHDVEERRYRLGAAFMRIAILVFSGYRIRALAQPLLRKIVENTGETALLCLYQPLSGTMIFADKAESTHLLRYNLPLNRPSSLLWGASGRSILAFLEASEIERLFAQEQVSPASGEPKPPLSLLHEELAAIRHRGYAVTRGQKIPGAIGINAPFFDHGVVVGNVGITMPESRLVPSDIEHYAACICTAAKQLTEMLAEDNHGPNPVVGR